MGNDFSKGVDSAVSIITGIITGDMTGGLAGASAPWLAEQIKIQAGDNETARLVAHAILGAVVAELQGNSALSGGVGAVSGELASKVIINTLYGGKDASELTEEEKQTISALSQLASGLAVAAGGGNFGDASAAINSSKNAVENNALTTEQIQKRDKESAQCNSHLGCELATGVKWDAISIGQDLAYISGGIVGVPEGLYDNVIGLVEALATVADQPVESFNNITDFIENGGIKEIPEMILNDWIEKIAKGNQLYGSGENGFIGSFEAGNIHGKVITDVTGTVFIIKNVITGSVKTVSVGIKKTIGSTANIKSVTAAETGIKWGEGIKGQGMPWEDFVGNELPAGARLPENFKTFDYFDRITKNAVSVKTLDTTTAAKLANPKQIYNTLKNYIDKVADFEKHSLSGVTITSSDIMSREIRLAVPAATTKAQWQHISNAIDYGKSRGVKLIVTEVK